MNRGRYAAALIALFLGALAANLHQAGVSPVAWSDTFNDETAVRRCVVDDSCSLMGVGTSVPGFLHAVGWFELRTMLAWLGLGLDGAHVFIQILNALAVVLVFDLATQLSGRFAGAVAAWVFVQATGTLTIQTAALYNTAPLPFLGAIFALACTAAVLKPGTVSIALAALVAAVLANVHLACVLTGLSVVGVALLAPRRRITLALFGAGVFAVATFVIAPPSWLHDASRLIHRPDPVGNVPMHARLEGIAVIRWSLFAALAWMISLRSDAAAWTHYRRRSLGALVIVVPFVFAFIVASFVGLDADGKYFAHLTAACAIAVALPLGTGLRWRVHELDAAHPWHRSVATAAPFVLAAMLPFGSVAVDQQALTIADLEAVTRRLTQQHGWSSEQIIRGVKSSFGIPALMGLREIAIQQPVAAAATADRAASALLLPLSPLDLPQPLPSNWNVIRSSSHTALVLIVTRSRLDWSRFEVCLHPIDGPAQPCQQSGISFDPEAPALDAPHMPWGGPHWHATLALRVPLHAAVPGFAEEVFMPRRLQLCGGRVAAPSNGAIRVDSDRRHAVLAATDGGAPRNIELEWQLGAPECSGTAYDGWPPFFVAGDPITVRLIESILRKGEVHDGA